MANCSLDQEPLYSYARGTLLTSAQQGNSSNWTKFNLGSTSWSTLSTRPNPTRIAVATAFPFLNAASYPDFTSCNDTARWEAVYQATNRIKACNVGDCFVPGQNPNNVPIKYFVHNSFTEDYFALDDTVGTALSYLTRNRYQSSIYSAGIQTAIGFGLTGCGGGSPFETVLEGGGRQGYATGPHLMVAAAAAAQGVAQSTFLKLNYQMYTIRKPTANRYSLKFTNGKTVLAKKVILNVGTWNYQRHLDKHDNILFDNAAPNLKALYSISELTGAKTWLLYEPAWWIQAGIFKGSVQTDETFKFMRFHQGHILCSNSSTSSCRGLFLASYQILHIHEHKSMDWQTEGPDVSSNLYVARRNNTRDAYILDMLHTRLMKIMGSGIVDTTNIAPPTLGLFVNWFEDPWNRCGSYTGTTAIAPGSQEATAIRPLPAEEIYIAQIDWMISFTGYAEAALIMAERIAYRHFGLAQPSWLPNTWYNYVIKTFNM